MSNDIGFFLQDQLKKKNLSVVELEKKSGLKKNAARYILEGKTLNPKTEVLGAIARALECPIEELLTRLKSPRNKEHTWDFDLFIDSTNAVCSTLKQHDIQTTIEVVFSIIKDVYNYAAFGASKSADMTFTNWLICKTFRIKND